MPIRFIGSNWIKSSEPRYDGPLGLADMHMHLRPDWLSDAWPVSPLKLYLANGVTTIRCFGPGDETGRYALTWRKEIESGRLVGPRILTCGP